MIAEFTRGASYVLRGFKLIRTPRIRRFVLIPLLVNVVLFAGLIAYGISEFTYLTEWLLSFLPEWLTWLKWLLWPVFALLAMLFVFYLFTPIANLIGAPFNSLLAEKLEIHLSGNQPASDQAWSRLFTDIPKTLISEFKKLGYLMIWTIPLLILLMIPGLNLLAPFVWFIFGAWMLALEYCDYPMANHRLAFREERWVLKQQKSLGLGFGSAVLLMTTIPVINFLAMPVAVAGATALWVERLQATAVHLQR